MGRPDIKPLKLDDDFAEWTYAEEQLYHDIGLEKNIIASSELSLDSAKVRLAYLYTKCPHTHLNYREGETVFCMICQRRMSITDIQPEDPGWPSPT